MANWISNHLWIEGERAALDEFGAKVRGRPAEYYCAGEESPIEDIGIVPLSFNSVVPVPSDILAAGFRAAGSDWQIEHWGTQWEIDECKFEDEGEHLYYFFSTAYSVPLPWYEAATRQFPHLSFRLLYRDWCASVEGRVLIKNGSEVFHYARENFHLDTLNRDSHSYDRVPVGEEDGDWQPKAERPCAECGADFLEFHEWGCLKEPCPICHGQLVSCGCEYERHHCGAA